MSFPCVHVVTNDRVLARTDFAAAAADLMAAGGRRLALHIRGHGTPARVLYEHTARLCPEREASGAALLVNDRIDVALAARADGVQLGRRSVPVGMARSLLAGRTIGYSAHTAAEAGEAFAEGADFVLLGSVYASPTHAGASGSGPVLVRSAVAATTGRVVAIGGITPQRMAEVAGAGAVGVAVLSGVWDAQRPGAAVEAFLAAADVFEKGSTGECGKDAGE